MGTKLRRPLQQRGAAAGCILALLTVAAWLNYAPGPASAAAPTPGADSCPKWLHDYIAFHRSTKGRPDAKYLVYYCTAPGCEGIGDRMQSIMWLTKLAISLNRLILVHSPHPVPLPHFFLPGTIDWTPAGTPYTPPTAPDYTWLWNGRWGPPDVVANGTFAAAIAPRPFVSILLTRNLDVECPRCPDVHHYHPRTNARCLWQALFRPSPALNTGIDAHLRATYGTTNPPFVAVHIRVGGLAGEAEAVDNRGVNGFRALLHSLHCSRNLTQRLGLNLSQAPVQLLVDNVAVRRMVQGGYFAGMVSPPSMALHFDKGGDGDPAKYMSTLVEMGVLARARCLVAVQSLFNLMAWYWGGQRCVVPVKECINAVVHDQPLNVTL